jgi:hypothetical protein
VTISTVYRLAMTETRVTLVPKPDTPIACSLDAGEAVDRTAVWSEILSHVVTREPTDSGVRLQLPSDPALVAQVADLIVREADCCAFFAFAITVDHDAVWLEVAAPPDGLAVVERLFA